MVTSTWPSRDLDAAQHAEIGDRQHRDLRIDHLAAAPQRALAQVRSAQGPAASPGGSRIGPLHRLQLAQQMAEVLAVAAAAPALCIQPLSGRERRLAARQR